jgi:hypothetical protein
MRRRLLAPLTLGLVALSVPACGGVVEYSTTTNRTTPVTSPIDLYKLDCPSGTVKAIVTAITVTIKEMNDENNRNTTDVRQRVQVICIGRGVSGSDLYLKIETLFPTNSGQAVNTTNTGDFSPFDPFGDFYIGPDDTGSLAQLEASLGPGGFTPVNGVGDAAASVVETLSGHRTVTLYVRAGTIEFHISLQQSTPDALIQEEERRIAMRLVPQLATPAASTASGSAQPDTIGNFINGVYAASLLTTDEVSAALGRPVLPLTENGGRLAYSPGIDVSNAYTNAKDGSERLDIQVYRATDAAAARTFMTKYLQLPNVTPDPAFAGLGDVAYFETASGKLYVLSGREIVGIAVQGHGPSPTDIVAATKHVAAIIAPRLRH